MWENWTRDDEAFAVLVRPFTDNDFVFLVEQFGILGQTGRAPLRVVKTTSEASFRGHFQARLTEREEYSTFLGLLEANARIPELPFVGFSVDSDDPKSYDRIQAFLYNPLRQEGDRLLPANPGRPLSHAAISIDEARRIWEEQPQGGAAVEEVAEPAVAGPARLVDPPVPVDPLMAILQQMNQNHAEIKGKIEAQKQELKQEWKSSLADAVQEHVDPLRHQMKSFHERLSILEGTAAKPGTSGAAIPTGPASAPPGLSLTSEFSFPDSTRAVEVQAKLNKWANPAARDVKLVERTLNRDKKLGISEFRSSEINREPLQLSLGDGNTLAIQNGRKSTFQGWEDFLMAIRNFMEILQTAGLVSISEGNRYDSGLASLRSVLSIQQIAAVHDAFRLELIDKNSWDFAAGIPQWLIATAGGYARGPQGQQQQQQSGHNFKGNCNYCHEYGHKKVNCPKAKTKESNSGGKPQPDGPGGRPQPFPAHPSTGVKEEGSSCAVSF